MATRAGEAALRIHLAILVVFNTLTVGIWLMVEIGAPDADQAPFWPGWFIGFWLPALGLHGFWACRRPLNELARAEQNHGATDSNYR